MQNSNYCRRPCLSIPGFRVEFQNSRFTAADFDKLRALLVPVRGVVRSCGSVRSGLLKATHAKVSPPPQDTNSRAVNSVNPE